MNVFVKSALGTTLGEVPRDGSFAGAAILLELSTVWDAAWWWWHFLRLIAYLTGCVYAAATYWSTEQQLVALNRELQAMNRDLDRTVAARTAEL